MLVKTSKEVTDRQKAFVFLHSVFLLRGPEVASALTQELHGSDLPDGEEPGFLSAILGFGRALTQRLERLVSADEEHYIRKAVYTALLKERDRLTQGLTRLVVGLRRTVSGQHDQADLGQLGFEGETAREPVPLLRQADRIVEIFDSGGIEAILGPPIFHDSSFDPKDNSTQLKAEANELRKVLVRIGDSTRQTEQAYLTKKEAQEDYDKLFTRAGRIFEDHCRLVGLDELADRIRPSKRRPGVTEQKPPEVLEPVTERAAAETTEAEATDAQATEAEAGNQPETASA